MKKIDSSIVDRPERPLQGLGNGEKMYLISSRR